MHKKDAIREAQVHFLVCESRLQAPFLKKKRRFAPPSVALKGHTHYAHTRGGGGGEQEERDRPRLPRNAYMRRKPRGGDSRKEQLPDTSSTGVRRDNTRG